MRETAADERRSRALHVGSGSAMSLDMVRIVGTRRGMDRDHPPVRVGA